MGRVRPLAGGKGEDTDRAGRSAPGRLPAAANIRPRQPARLKNQFGLPPCGVGAAHLMPRRGYFAGSFKQDRSPNPNFPVANIDIQRKKSAPSPWLLVALALALLAGAAWYFLRPAPADDPTPPAARETTAPPDTLAGGLATDTLAAYAPASEVPGTPSSTAGAPASAQANSPAAAETPATRAALLVLVGTLTDLADRPDLRADATVREQRDNLTSATARLADGAANASLRPGLVGVAAYLRTIQQRGYPALEADALALQTQAATLTGRDATATEQAQNHDFLVRATALADALSAPPR